MVKCILGLSGKLLFALPLLCALFVSSHSTLGQSLIAPVRTQVTVTPPYSLNLSDYSQPNFDRFLVQVFLEDQKQDLLNISLQLTIAREGVLVYQSAIFPIVQTLSPGLPLTLTGNELTPLFSNGGTNPLIKEGVYQFSILVYDQVTGAKLSNGLIGSQIVFLSQNDPPFLNMPRNNSTVDAQSQVPILFQWTPRHNAINTLGNIKYTLEIFSVPQNMNPNDVVNSNSTFRVYSNEFLFGEVSYPLSYLERLVVFNTDDISNPQNRYAWRVKAEELDAVGNTNTRLSLFKNEGYSEVFTFYYNTPCNPPTLLALSANAPGQVSVSWLGEFNHTGYELLYKVFKSNGQYQIEPTDRANNTLKNLESATTYEIAVRTYCNGVPAPVKILGNITTKNDLVEPCTPPSNISIQKTLPIDESTPGSYTLSWTASPNALKYNVYTTLNPGSGAVSTTQKDITSTSLTPKVYTTTDVALSVQVDAVCANASASGVPVNFNLASPTTVEVADPCLPATPLIMEVEVLDTINGVIRYQLTWNTTTSHTGYKFRYKERDNPDATWNETTTDLIEPSLLLSGLQKGVNYSYQIDFVCATGNSGYTTEKYFFIEETQEVNEFVDPGTADCFPPVSTSHELESTTEAALVWDRVSEAQNYEVIYRTVGATSWAIENTTSRKLALKSLSPETEYEYQVRALCSGEWSVYTSLKKFKTEASAVPTENVGCPRIENIEGTSESYIIALNWVSEPSHSAYLIEYRSEKQNISDWYSVSKTKPELLVELDPTETPDPPLEDGLLEHILRNLALGTRYDVRITATCGTEQSRPSRVVSFGIPPAEEQLLNFACGKGGEPCIYNPGEEMELVGGSKFILGDFEFEVRDDSPTSGSITAGYSGKALLVVPYMDYAQVEVDFNNVFVNETTKCGIGDATVVRTVVRAIPASLAADIQAILDIIDGLLDTAQDVTQLTAETLESIDELLALIDSPINTERYANLTPEEMFVEGKRIFNEAKGSVREIIKQPLNGDNYVTTLATLKDGAALVKAAYDKLQQSVNLDATPGYAIYFHHNGTSVDYFDEYNTTTNILPAFYEQLEMADEPASTYYVPYVAISKVTADESGNTGTRKIYAEIDIASFEFDRVSFTTSSTAGQFIQNTVNQTGVTIDENLLVIEDKGIIGGKHIVEVTVPSDAKRVYALYETNSGKKDRLGKLNVVETEPIIQEIVIIPNEEEHQFTVNYMQTLQNELDAIYRVAEVSFIVSLKQVYYNTSWDGDDDGLMSIEDASLLSRYSNEMNSMLTYYYTLEGNIKNEGIAYLFAVNGFNNSGTENVLGYMPRNKTDGFINKDANVKTIAHEIGHGIFRFGHPWEFEGNSVEGTTSNLMDNKLEPVNTDLKGAQWLQVHKPEFDLYGLDNFNKASLIGCDHKSLLAAESRTLVLYGITDFEKELLLNGSYVDFHYSGHGYTKNDYELNEKALNAREKGFLFLDSFEDFKKYNLDFDDFCGQSKLERSKSESQIVNYLGNHIIHSKNPLINNAVVVMSEEEMSSLGLEEDTKNFIRFFQSNLGDPVGAKDAFYQKTNEDKETTLINSKIHNETHFAQSPPQGKARVILKTGVEFLIDDDRLTSLKRHIICINTHLGVLTW